MSQRCDLHEWLDILVVDCFLVQMMRRRDELTFRQEMKFRNKLVEYLTDWIMGNSHQVNVQGDICSMSRYLLTFVGGEGVFICLVPVPGWL